MRFVENEPVSSREIAQLRAAVGWNCMESAYCDPGLISYYHIAVYEEEKLIGYVDCVSNGVTDAYIQDLMVDPARQHRGIATALMNRMIAVLRERKIYMISVVFEEELKSFYQRFGFHCMLSGQLQTFECE